MELELGLKITKVVDDIGSANILVSKNRGGALFLSSETETMFILTAHLNGYRKENVEVDINEDGTKVTIRGAKPVQEMLMVGWKVVTNDIEIRGFKKSFKIPDGVILDKIKARFNDDASLLTISIPKSKKGVVRGKGLEELEDDEEVLGMDSQPSNVNEEKRSIQENPDSGFKELKENGNGEASEEKFDENGKGQGKPELLEESKCDKNDDEEGEKTFMQENHKSDVKEEDEENGKEAAIEQTESKKASLVKEQNVLDENEGDKNEEEDAETDEENKHKCDHKEAEAKETSMQENQEPDIKEVMENRNKEVIGKENSEKGSLVQDNGLIDEEQENVIESANEFDQQIHDTTTTSLDSQTIDQDKVNEDNTPKEKSKLCVPIVVGSALVVSFIVFVFHFIRSKNQTSRSKN